VTRDRAGFRDRMQGKCFFLFISVADPCHFGVDPDPAIFVIDLQDTNKNYFKKKFFCLLLSEGKFTSFSKIKSQKEVTKQ
jgi:hypothetical protein